jgi:hypothetical protein
MIDCKAFLSYAPAAGKWRVFLNVDGEETFVNLTLDQACKLKALGLPDGTLPQNRKQIPPMFDVFNL